MKLKNIIASVLLTLGVGVAGISTISNTTKKDIKVAEAASTKIISLKPSDNWKEASAWFAAWVWGGDAGNGEWHTFGDSNGDLIYDIVVPQNATGMKILRKDPAKLGTNDWNSWAETGDISITSNNCFSNSGWNTSFSGSKLSTYNRADLYLIGTFQSPIWTHKDANYLFYKETNNWTRDFDLNANNEFKINNGSWGVGFGANKFTTSTSAFTGTDNLIASNTGTYRITMPIDMLAPQAKGTIELLDNTKVVKTFVDKYMDFTNNPHDPDPSNPVNSGTECSALYQTVKEALKKLTPKQKEVFKTYDDGHAYERLKAWATANGETINDNTLEATRLSGLMNITRFANESNGTILVVIAISILSFTFVLLVLLRKKKN